MRPLLIGILSLLLASAGAQAAAGRSQSPEAPLRVPFLPAEPTVDGRLDAGLDALLPAHEPAVVERSDPSNPTIDVRYRIGYGTSFLYLYIEVAQETLVVRDRAYQHGDGFHLVLSLPDADGTPSEQFYVLGFSPGPGWQRQFVWYRDVELGFTQLEDTRFEVHAQDGRTGFELVLPWTEVYPYHPWLSDRLGINLCYVQAVGAAGRNYYFTTPDVHIQSERRPRRAVALRFAPPGGRGGGLHAVLARNHITVGQGVSLRVAAASAEEGRRRVRVRVQARDGLLLGSRTFSVRAGHRPAVSTHVVDVGLLGPGDYELSWRDVDGGAEGSTLLTVLPEVDFDALRREIETFRGRVAPGSITTLLFLAEHAEGQLRERHPYDAASEVHVLLRRLRGAVRAARQGRDLVATRTGEHRRAYRSAVDGTLQPYTVYVPPGVDDTRRYPLLVFLHGSGHDDRGVLHRDFVPPGFIALAPSGRGTSNAFSADHAQDDIREAVADVVAHYPVDSTRIVVAGFSMGGYGAYRTYYEDPDRYRAVAVLSGHPDLANRWLGGTHPNFLMPGYAQVFDRVPVFIFHGAQDRNCAVELTRTLVERLREAGAHVQFHVDAARGHELPNRATRAAFRQWMREAVDGAPR